MQARPWGALMTMAGAGRRPLLLVAAAALAGLTGACSSTTEPAKVQAATTPAAPLQGGRYKVGKPYQIKGVWYYPAVDYDYVEEGVASWYGPGFHGKQTANGEIYDQNDMTAAHRTLPMPSVVRVTNLENGRSIKLTVNDRGPFARNRIIDVSRRAAQLLAFHQAGTTPVRVEIVADESRQLALALTGSEYPGQALASRQPPATYAPAFAPVVAAPAVAEAAAADLPPAETAAAPVDPLPVDPLPVDPLPTWPAPVAAEPAPPLSADAAPPVVEPLYPQAGASPGYGGGFAPLAGPAAMAIGATAMAPAGRAWIQAGAFAERGNAEKARAQLARLGPVAVSPSPVGGRGLYRVRVGPLPSFDDADRLLAQVIRSGFPGSHIVVD